MRRLLFLSTLFVMAVMSGTNVLGQPQRRGHIVRWDLVQFAQGTVLAGGIDVGRDTATGDTISLTGSGQARPAPGNAAGGGLFTHRRADGTLVANGIYVVTDFIDWVPAGGVLPAADGIGHQDQASAGILTLGVRLLPVGGSPVNGILEVHCELPEAAFHITEGIRFSVQSFHFIQNQGGTLFHITK